MSLQTKELIFVYNADSDLFSQVTDFAHKIFSPQTYDCPLCALTYGNLTVKTKWRDFLKGLLYPQSFFHRDEFIRRFPDYKDISLPTIYLKEKNNLTILISAQELKSFPNLEDLILALQKKIETL